MSGQQPRWVEIDPLGHHVLCTEPAWVHAASRHIELTLHEPEVRATVRDPDQLYIDWASTTTRMVGGRINALIVHYVADRRTHGKWAGNLIVVIVKWLDEGNEVRGYLHTAYLPNRVASRLQLRWSRST